MDIRINNALRRHLDLTLVDFVLLIYLVNNVIPHDKAKHGYTLIEYNKINHSTGIFQYQVDKALIRLVKKELIIHHTDFSGSNHAYPTQRTIKIFNMLTIPYFINLR